MEVGEAIFISINGAAATIAGFGALGVTNVIKMSTDAGWTMLLVGSLVLILSVALSCLMCGYYYIKKKFKL
jgi:hypothetical protein